ncbi:MAG: hypothetical protein OK474_06890 [Thaumarchaeota archaeon]|nr:hypothetical protein [Nitrososphaerota archaeon]
MLIEDKVLKNALLKALADEEACRIMGSTASRSKSVVDLIRECNLPHTSAYRLVNEMKENGLLVIDRMVLTDDGKKYAMYRSTFSNITVTFDRGEIELEVRTNKEVADKAFRLFFSLRDEETKE